MPPKKSTSPSKGAPKQARSPTKSGATQPVKKSVVAKAKGTPVSKGAVAGKKTLPQKGSKKEKTEKHGQDKVKTSKFSKEDLAAIKLQSHFRVILARKKLGRKKIEKIRYEEEMERLEREASMGELGGGRGQ